MKYVVKVLIKALIICFNFYKNSTRYDNLKHRHREQMYGYQGEKLGVRWTGRLELTYIHYWYYV